VAVPVHQASAAANGQPFSVQPAGQPLGVPDAVRPVGQPLAVSGGVQLVGKPLAVPGAVHPAGLPLTVPSAVQSVAQPLTTRGNHPLVVPGMISSVPFSARGTQFVTVLVPFQAPGTEQYPMNMVRLLVSKNVHILFLLPFRSMCSLS